MAGPGEYVNVSRIPVIVWIERIMPRKDPRFHCREMLCGESNLISCVCIVVVKVLILFSI